MTNPIEPADEHAAYRRPSSSLMRPARALAGRIAPLMAWARLTKGSLQLSGADAMLALDPRDRAQLWHVLVETISTIGTLAPDLLPEAGLMALRRLADRLRDQIAIGPPRAAAVIGAEPPEIFVLEILNHDLQPPLGRWQSRLDAWLTASGRSADWPLLGLWRKDLMRTRGRLVERSWQLGMALGVPGLDRVLAERPAAVPVLIALDEIANAEAASGAPTDAASRKAGWRIYVEAAAGLPARELLPGPGALGAAIGALDALAGEIRTELKAMPLPRPDGGIGTIQALAFSLLTAGVLPFLVEWRPRYQRFAASGRPEAKWRRAKACGSALAATRERCLPAIRALGRSVGAPPLPDLIDDAASGGGEAPLQLPAPPPATRP